MSGCPYEENNSSCRKNNYADVHSGTTLNATLSDNNTNDTQLLSTERESSSIPKSKPTNEFWLYPSQKMFFNALQKKGMPTETKEVEMLVSIHNFLNEGVWNEIKRWETLLQTNATCLSLKKFVGRPTEPTLKSRFLSWLRISPRPFDRHDWYVDRCGTEVKYVIDYYKSKGQSDEEAVFYVDVRPHLNSFSALKHRFFNWYNTNKHAG